MRRRSSRTLTRPSQNSSARRRPISRGNDDAEPSQGFPSQETILPLAWNDEAFSWPRAPGSRQRWRGHPSATRLGLSATDAAPGPKAKDEPHPYTDADFDSLDSLGQTPLWDLSFSGDLASGTRTSLTATL